MTPEPTPPQPVGQTSATPRTPLPHYPVLDGIRGMAILLVLWCHFGEGFELAGPLGNLVVKLSDAGRHGVDLFFVLSGFLITGILIETKGRPSFFKSFFARRALRIFPLYYVALLIVFFILPWFFPFDTPGTRYIAEHQSWLWLYGANILMPLEGTNVLRADFLRLSPFWSLAVEEHFYLFWPLLIAIVPRQRIAWLCIATIVTATLFRVGFILGGANDLWAILLTPSRVDALAAGGLLAALMKSPGFRYQARLWWRLGAALACVALVAALIIRSGPVFELRHIYKYALIAFIFTIFILECLNAKPDGLLSRAAGHVCLRTLGRYSYGIYVYHCLLLPFFQLYLAPHLPPGWAGYALFLGAGSATSFAVAALSYHLFEQRILRLKKYFPYGQPDPPPQPAAVALPGSTTSSAPSGS